MTPQRHFQSDVFVNSLHEKQSGAVEACWAHNPEVRGSKTRSGKQLPFFLSFVSLMTKSFKSLFLNLRKQILHILHCKMIFDERFIFSFISNIFYRIMKKFFFPERTFH